MPAVASPSSPAFPHGFSDYLRRTQEPNIPVLGAAGLARLPPRSPITATLALAVGGIPGNRVPRHGVLAGIAEVVGLSALYHGLSVGKMSIVAAVAATAPVVPVITSVISGDAPGALVVRNRVAIGGVTCSRSAVASENEPHALKAPSVSIIVGLPPRPGSAALAMDHGRGQCPMGLSPPAQPRSASYARLPGDPAGR